MEQRELSGALFKNDRKEQDTHADYQGSCMIGGQEYWLNGWIKEGKRGKFFSLSFKPKNQQQQRQQPKPSNQSSKEADDSVPF